MKKDAFWQQLETRMEENARLAEHGGMSSRLVNVLAPIGLDFWKFGVGAAFLVTIPLFYLFREKVFAIARALLLL